GAGCKSERHPDSSLEESVRAERFSVVADPVGVLWWIFDCGAACRMVDAARWIQTRNSDWAAGMRYRGFPVYSGGFGARLRIFPVCAVCDGEWAVLSGSGCKSLCHDTWTAGELGAAVESCAIVQLRRCGDHAVP